MSGNSRGFTLLEMMVTLAVMVILLTVAMPAWQTLMQNQRLISTRDNLLSAMSQARASAVNDDSVVTICPYSAASSTACGSSWSAGWVISEQQSGSAVLLKSQPLVSGSPTIGTLAAGTASGTIASVSFNPRPPYVAVAQTGDFRICDSRGAAVALSFNLQSTGYAQSAASAGATLSGASLSCP
ncbi:GspH/FimT family pseudopilin [Chromobacterium subtsugae]|uniref:Type II secretion system protein H n=1 Tax=Chromobacterium subtsugae TaxID=251747 RepID=A0ABS7FIJ9_9NEIS|nr:MULTISPECIES: GspH/FimT family pseudopilin [Chromobacterium]KUM04367.1 hypothetical protein Cv017_14805 [Chromobacterium subtsugae]KZE87384.1 hypothetical protein AWB61_10905 [Chromobacterium sp. F49]MBW7566518.1 GspH/FimT family pseudopilin [Chromobacterium subtsugae]MBW8289887.1 GspH/FimT family pseudopilin [Chromobacterium subtsugae]OBU87327.1 hypothetical protein MY55_07575 [Chromobacterium subtsugae]